MDTKVTHTKGTDEALLDRFWKTAERIESAWEYLVRLAEMEWKSLLADELFRIHRITSKKEALVRFLEQEERRLADISRQLAGSGAKGASLLDAVSACLTHQDSRRLEYWRARRESLRRMVRMMNGRIVRWLHTRLQFVDQVEEAFRAAVLEQPPVYDSSGQAKAPGARKTAQSGQAVTRLSDEVSRQYGLARYLQVARPE